MGEVTHDTDCRVDRAWLGPTIVLSVSGAVDMLTAPGLEKCVAACLNEKPAAVIIDLTDTEFLGSAGISVLVHACAQAGDRHIGFGVAADAPATSRPITLLGLDAALNLHSTVEGVQRSIAADDPS